MRKLIVVFAALAALAVAGIAQSSVSDDDQRKDRLFGGGRFVVDFDPSPGELFLPRELSVYATGLNGRRGSGTRWYGHPGAAQPVVSASVSCLGVEGNLAVIGAIDQFGNPTVQYFRDNGPPGPDPADGITPVLIMNAADVAQFMPKHFPRMCPAATPPAEWGDPWTTLESGDIAVVDS